MPKTHRRPPSHVFAHLCLPVAALCLSLAASLTHAEEFSNFLGMKFVDIPAGSFLMGSCQPTTATGKDSKNHASTGCSGPDLDALINEVPRHRVSVPGFQMSKDEVTLGQFKRYIIATDNTDLVTDDFMKHNAHGDTAPVVHVSWNEAKSFIAWLNKSKPENDHGTYRLPSEAEWEYACRASGNHTYCGGNNADAVAWHKVNSGGHQHPIGKKGANVFGLYDMSGNVWEWAEDCYHDNYDGAPTDGSPWTIPCSKSGRVLRGGSWSNDAKTVRTAVRINATSVIRSNNIGFRLARVLP
ncbi:MAG: formylglycine-generating enzyme family protein [Gammaproteobacteria bacterium]|nr:formylglycine-generating enzyme family protein [Gammaproteobacteria bacterium]